MSTVESVPEVPELEVVVVTKIVLTKDELDDYVRPRVESVVISSGGNSSRTLHIQREGHAEPVCSARLRTVNQWLEKSVTVYPPNFHPFCDHCVEERFGIEVIDE